MTIACLCGSGARVFNEKVESDLVLKTCSGCKQCFALESGQDHCETIEESLKSRDTISNGWRKASGHHDLKKHKILSQVVYRKNEKPRTEHLETPFAHPNILFDEVLLLWDKGSSVGFATVRKLQSDIGVVLDTIFIKESHRRKGHCSSLLDILLDANSLLCISQPTSTGMLITLLKYLKKHREKREQIVFIDTDGDMESVWWSALSTSNERSLDFFKIISV